MSDSSTVIPYINNKGGIKSKKCSDLAKQIWFGVLKIILLPLQVTYQENAILKKTNFLENLTVIQNGN